jgi:hypothetical protein
LNTLVHSNLTQEQIQQIRLGTSLGASAGALRRKLNITISKDQMYYYRKTILQIETSETENLAQVTNDLVNWDFQINRENDDNKTLRHLYAFNRSVYSFRLIHDIMIIDDTMCTNAFDLPLFFLIGVDHNNCSQIVSFGLLRGKKNNDIVGLLMFLNTKLAQPVRLFIGDRSQAQFNAVK